MSVKTVSDGKGEVTKGKNGETIVVLTGDAGRTRAGCRTEVTITSDGKAKVVTTE